MASERQVAANRRNARKSTGPRSAAGKSRASRNSTRHGFSAAARISSPERQMQIEHLARQIAGDATDSLTLQHARAAAKAQFQLTLIRRVQVVLIERIRVFGRFETKNALSEQNVLRMMRMLQVTGDIPAVEIETRLPKVGIAEAVRRALPELRKLERFARRAIWSRRRALMLVAGRGAARQSG
jgi:hypothetical protein